MEGMQEECAKVPTVFLYFLLQDCRSQLEGLLTVADCLSVSFFTSLQISNGRAVDREALSYGLSALKQLPSVENAFLLSPDVSGFRFPQ